MFSLGQFIFMVTTVSICIPFLKATVSGDWGKGGSASGMHRVSREEDGSFWDTLVIVWLHTGPALMEAGVCPVEQLKASKPINELLILIFLYCGILSKSKTLASPGIPSLFFRLFPFPDNVLAYRFSYDWYTGVTHLYLLCRLLSRPIFLTKTWPNCTNFPSKTCSSCCMDPTATPSTQSSKPKTWELSSTAHPGNSI